MCHEETRWSPATDRSVSPPNPQERQHGCGHGECTTASTPCRYETPSRAVRWSPADLDRCEHGRHSIDSCFDCPGGASSGNLFLLCEKPSGYRYSNITRTVDGRVEVRIGTMVRGEPIWVVVRDMPRVMVNTEVEVTEQEAEQTDGE